VGGVRTVRAGNSGVVVDRSAGIPAAHYAVRYFREALTAQAAFDIVDAWLTQAAVMTVEPSPQHLRVMRDLLLPLGTGEIRRRMRTWRRLLSSTAQNSARRTQTSHRFRDFAGAIR